MTITRNVILAGMLLAVLAGCGRKGALEPPPDPSAVAAKPAATGDGGAVTPGPVKSKKKKVPINVPKEPFFLDPIL